MSMVYVGDGNWEYTFQLNGQPVRLNGQPIDRGSINITDTIHLGDLSTVEDNYFVGGEANRIGGPHPAYEEDYRCTLIVPLLS